ncbi:MAG: hypothetical protein ABI665_10635 [Vicinamibacterales bacterium]
MALFDRHWRLIVVLSVTLVTFSAVVRFPFSIIDDPSNVVRNPLVAAPLSQGLMGLLRTPAMGYPHTVTVLSFALDRALAGEDPSYYHAVNLLVHLVNIALLYMLLLRFGISTEWAWLPAAIFALHPLVAEPVSWVIARKDLLATGFLLGAFNVIATGPAETAGVFRDWRWGTAAALCILAIFSKPAAITAPVLLWLVIRYARPSWTLRDVAIALAPIVAAGAFTMAVGVPDLQAQGAVVQRSVMQSGFDMTRAWTIHVWHLFWPRDLLAEYERTATADPAVWKIVAAFAVSLAIAAAALRTPRGSAARMAVLFIIAAGAPVAGVLPTWHWTADSYVYLPLVGVVMLAAASLPAADVPRAWTLAWAVLPLLAWLSYQQSITWSSGPATFAPVAAHYADNPRPLNRLAFAYLYENRPDQAAPLLVKLDAMAPGFEFNRAQRAWAAYRLGEASRGDAVIARCVAAADVECLTVFWNDVLAMNIAPDRPGTGALADAYLGLAEAGTPLPAATLRGIADALRQRGLIALAFRATVAAARSER